MPTHSLNAIAFGRNLRLGRHRSRGAAAVRVLIPLIFVAIPILMRCIRGPIEHLPMWPRHAQEPIGRA
jgi:hypothetical protein